MHSYISLLMREEPTSMTYLQPNHTSNMKHFQELVNNFKFFIIFAESSTVDQVLAMALYLKEKYFKEIDFPGDYF